MTLPPRIRKLALALHLATSVGWVGVVAVYLAYGLVAVTAESTERVRVAWTAMEIAGWYVAVPFAWATVVTGLVMALGTQWGLFRNYWVVVSLSLTLVCAVVLVLHMPDVSALADRARTARGRALDSLGGDLLHPGVGLVLLLFVLGMNVYKPRGLTRHGWRTQRGRPNRTTVA